MATRSGYPSRRHRRHSSSRATGYGTTDLGATSFGTTDPGAMDFTSPDIAALDPNALGFTTTDLTGSAVVARDPIVLDLNVPDGHGAPAYCTALDYTTSAYTATDYTLTASATASPSTQFSEPIGLVDSRKTTSSYHDFNGVPYDNQDPQSQAWIYAREAKSQQAGIPAGQARPYPSCFSNGEGLPLTTPGSILRPGRGSEWLHAPLIPGQARAWTPQSGVSRGGVRSVYTDGNAAAFDVMYHDPNAGLSARGYGQFSMATYRPAAPKRIRVPHTRLSQTRDSRSRSPQTRSSSRSSP